MRHIMTIMLMAVAITTASAVNSDYISPKSPLPKGVNAKMLEIKRGEPVDTVSYALGANIGLTVGIAHIGNGIDIDTDIVRYNILDVYVNDDVDVATVDEASALLTSFHYERMMPYMRARQQRAAADTDDNLTELPAIYDDKYTMEEISSAIGYVMGRQIADSHCNIDIAWVIRGYDDGILLRAEGDIDEAMLIGNRQMMETFQKIQHIEMEAVKAENMRLSEAWLADIEKLEGVHKSASGLLYRVERVGNGAYPKYDTSKVTVHYEGKLRDGKVFDSSYARGETITFALNRVIKGWTEGMKYINEGGKITLWIPSALAYGERGAGDGTIAPNEALMFTIELFEVEN